jgi:hypothetical protein
VTSGSHSDGSGFGTAAAVRAATEILAGIAVSLDRLADAATGPPVQLPRARSERCRSAASDHDIRASGIRGACRRGAGIRSAEYDPAIESTQQQRVMRPVA